MRTGNSGRTTEVRAEAHPWGWSPSLGFYLIIGTEKKSFCFVAPIHKTDQTNTWPWKQNARKNLPQKKQNNQGNMSLKRFFSGGVTLTPASGREEKKMVIDSMKVEVLRSQPIGRSQSVGQTIVKCMYNVRKDSYPDADLERLRNACTAKPRTHDGSVVQYKLYVETDRFLCVPRFIGLSLLGYPQEDRTTDGEPMNHGVTLAVQPRGYQSSVLDAIQHVIARGGGCGAGGMLVAGCGTGKTYCGINTAVRHRRKTAILVNKSDLQSQWKERILQFVNNATVGIVQGSTVETECDFVIFMAQSISTGKYGPEVFQPFGLLIVDEAHHWAAKTLSKTMTKFSARAVIGLSATPNRKDGLGYALEYFFGSPIATISRMTEG
ncbi:MAG: hypothetical protein CMD33_09865, partial [Flavobacteriales bacterium]|nr:hypothetical protein [Flavobacteriales bacterium]